MRRWLSAFVPLSGLLILPPTPAAAQQPPLLGPEEAPYVVPLLRGPFVLDGRVDDDEWAGIEPMPASMHLPDFGAAPSERTEFRVAHDGEYLYFSCRAFDSSPEEILATSLRRDDRGQRNDICSLYLDTLNDEENAVGFTTSAAGIRTDNSFANDGEAMPNFDWNAFWDAAATRDEDGWYGEMRIPFSTLLFQVVDGQVVMGVSMRRLIARKGEQITHPAMPTRFLRAWTKPSQMRKLVLTGVERSNPVYLTPYAIAGGGYSHALVPSQGGYLRETDRTHEAGFDLRYGITSNLTLDLTANTDFAQVEADDQQVNFTRFSLFFPEKRRFFQERGAIFEYSLGLQERLFHSRTVGLANGELVRLYGGGRIVGRVGEWDVGVLNMQTGASETLPSENQGVVRLRRRALNANSYVGGILTTRLGTTGDRNVVYGLDGIVRVVGQDYLTVNWAQSFDRQADFVGVSPDGPLDNGLARVSWQRRGADGLSYLLDVSRVGESFDPALGFLRRRDYLRTDFNLGYGWRPPSDSRLLNYSASMNGSVFRRLGSGIIETAEVIPTAIAQTRSRHMWTLTFPLRHEDLDAEFSLPGEASVPAGVYRFASAKVAYRPPLDNSFQPLIDLEAGQFYDGRQVSLSFGPTWSPSIHFSLGGNYLLDLIDFPDREQSLTAHVARLRSEVMFTTATSALGFVQYNSTEDAVTANLRLRYNPREGNDLYIVWNEGLTTDLRAFDPTPPRSSHRTLLVKYSHTFQLDL